MRTRFRREDGAAAVEFALIAGVLAMLIFGMLQFGLAFFQLQNLRAASREGARIGAVGATVDQVQQRTEQASVGALTAANGIEVRYTSNGTSWGSPLPTTSRACPPKSQQTTNSAVQVKIDLNNVSPSLREIFILDIPLLPSINLTGANISGEFRCEGN
jgi:Flp pilus assembly protein TadG